MEAAAKRIEGYVEDWAVMIDVIVWECEGWLKGAEVGPGRLRGKLCFSRRTARHLPKRRNRAAAGCLNGEPRQNWANAKRHLAAPVEAVEHLTHAKQASGAILRSAHFQQQATLRCLPAPARYVTVHITNQEQI